jgi:hypothetical protein
LGIASLAAVVSRFAVFAKQNQLGEEPI